jgi:geranylgeranylglycerol-phosphate geranylgeranyltransferase
MRLIRIERAISAMSGVVLTGIIVKDLNSFQWNYVIACLVVFFSALANFVLNDIHDVHIDRLNKRNDRPLAKGTIAKETAILFVITSTSLALGLSLLMRPIPRFMILLGLPLSLLYNINLKRYLVFKNLFTSLANVGVILIGALITDTVIEPLAYYLSIIGFFFSFSYEIMLDIGDIEGDRIMGVETIPIRYGQRIATWLSILIGLGAVFADPLPFFIRIDPRLFNDKIFLILIFIPIINRIRISKALLNDYSSENVSVLKKRLFRNLQIGGICYLIGFIF